MPRPFVILFEEKEGTTAIVQLLDNFESVDVVRHIDGSRWEPFDQHVCGPMRTDDFAACLDEIFDPDRRDSARLQSHYGRTSDTILRPLAREHAVGFKMRLRPRRFDGVPIVRTVMRWRVRRALLRAVRRHQVTVFIAVRQDVYRWGLSIYHGDGTGQRGHLQFKVASGEIRPDQLPPIQVDLEQLEQVIRRCERVIRRKQRLFRSIARQGIDVRWLRYEDFCDRPHAFLRDVLRAIDVPVDDAEVARALERGTPLKKVHSPAIDEWVVNHQEVEARFGRRFVAI